MKIFKILSIVSLFLCLSACGGGNQPKDVALDYTHSLLTGDLDGCILLSAPTTKGIMNTMKSLIIPDVIKKMKDSDPKIEYLETIEGEDGTTALVKLQISDYISTGGEFTKGPEALDLHLIKSEEGVWLVEESFK